MTNLQLQLNGPQQTQVGCRSLLYSLLSRAFRLPSAQQHEEIRQGQFANEVDRALKDLPYDGLKGGDWGRGGAGLDYQAVQSDYIALFEVGGNYGPPCFLYEGEYGGGRMKVMEEVLRFYHHFGLRLSSEKRDRPDHLASELEFMHMLTFKEAETLALGKERQAYLDAERDFLRLHLLEFAADVGGRVGSKGVPFYSDMARLAADFCQRELTYLRSL